MNFPFRNIAVNSFYNFLEDNFLEEYFYRHKSLGYYNNLLEKELEKFKDEIPNFENEILQVINTSNQESIDTLFASLKNIFTNNININHQYLVELIDDYNKRKYDEFIEIFKNKEEEYFSKQERYKYKHLEKYEAYDFPFGFYSYPNNDHNIKKKEVINYNFYCIEKNAELADYQYIDEYVSFIEKVKNDLLGLISKYLEPYIDGKIKANIHGFFPKMVVYVEGEHDISFIKKSAEVLGYNYILEKIDIRQRGGYRNLDKIWSFYKENSIEIIPQKKVLLYDCDTEKKNEDLGFIYKRVIPTIQGHQISKGIENLFGTITTQKAITYKKEFIDFTFIRKVTRGKDSYMEIVEINKEEKANFCKWICNVGTKEDFANFEIIFKLLDSIINIV